MDKIVLDEWLSSIIGKPVYLLQSLKTNFKLQDLPDGQIFVWTKVPVNDVEKLILLQKLGFYIVDTNVQFSISEKIYPINNANIRFAKSGDESQIRSLAKNSFKYNRFYKDPNISKDIASKIKEKWVGNFFLGKRGKWMIVIEEKAKIIGFLQIIEKEKNTILIDLIAVDEKNKGKGLAKDMISYAFKNCLKNEGVIEVGTQIANSSSIKLYSKLGFHINSASYVLHFHK